MFSLELNKIEHWVDYKPLFKPVSFILQAGDCYYLSGHNGVGKTTLLQIILNLLPYHAGQITWQSNGPDNDQPAHQAMAYIGHLLGMNTHLTVAENIALWHNMYRCSQATQIQTKGYLNQLKLVQHQTNHVACLSAGQKQRLAWIRLLMQQQPTWVLDESFSHLDQLATEMMQQLIIEHIEQGGAVIYTSHQALAGLQHKHRLITMAVYHD